MSSLEDHFSAGVEEDWRIAEQHEVSDPAETLGSIAMSMVNGDLVEVKSDTPTGEQIVRMRFDSIYTTEESIIDESPSTEAVGRVVTDDSKETGEETSDSDDVTIGDTPITITFRRGGDNEVKSSRFFL